MPIPFDTIPANILVPLFYAEVKPAQHPFNSSLKMIMIGQMTHNHTGGAAVNTPYILSGTLADELFGKGSMLSSMFQYAKDQAPFAEIWGIATAVDGGATKAAGSITISSAPSTSKSGMLQMLIAGRHVSCVVRPTDTQAVVAARLRSAINSHGMLPVRASLSSTDDTSIELECKWQGATGNDIKITTRYFGRSNRLADSLTTIVDLSGGIGSFNISAALAAIGNERFDVFAVGADVGASGMLNSLQDYFDGSSGRWSPYVQSYGHAFCTNHDDFADLITAGTPRNDPHVSIMGARGPNPPWDWTAAVAAHATLHWAAPPEISRPLQSLELKGIIPPTSQTDWFDISERQSLLEAGISTWRADDDYTVRIDRICTTYKTNVWGDADASWRDAVTMFQAMYFVRFMRATITGAFPRSALTTEDTGIPGFASPGKIADVLIHAYQFLETQGLVENTRLFAEGLVVERNAVDANRVDVLMRPDVVNQLRVIATVVETHLQRREDVISADALA